MRQTLMLATMAVMTACGASGNTPWDENRDGLITACEGLNPRACDATPGCEPAPAACAMSLREGNDETGQPVPCVGAETCRPTPPPPAFDCSHLPIDVCAVTARCEVVQQQACSGSGSTAPSEVSDPSVPAVPHCGVPDCQTLTACVNRAPASCESLSSDVCLTQPGCALEGSGAVCEIACDPDSGNCPPCAMPQLRCVTLPPPDVCGARDPNVCALDGRCVLEPGPVCDVDCAAGFACPPCAAPAPRCVPAPLPDVCAGRDLSRCDFDGRCAVEAWACPAICLDDGHGGCVPCAAPPSACVPVAPSCESHLDRASCQAAGCAVLELGLACTQDCRDDGNGGCLPCQDFACTDGSNVTGGETRPPQP